MTFISEMWKANPVSIFVFPILICFSGFLNCTHPYENVSFFPTLKKFEKDFEKNLFT